MIVDTESSVFSAPGFTDETLSRPFHPHLRAHWKCQPTSQHNYGRTRETNFGITCYWTFYPLLLFLFLPKTPPSSPFSSPPYVTNVCCLGPPLCLRRELFLFFFSIFSVNDLKWIITYIYLSSSNKRKRLLINFSNLEWLLTLSWQDTYGSWHGCS